MYVLSLWFCIYNIFLNTVSTVFSWPIQKKKKKKKTLFCLNILSADLIPRSHSLSMTIKIVFLCFSILYYRQNIFSFPQPPNSYVKTIPNVTVLENQAFWKQIKSWGQNPHKEDSIILWKKSQVTYLSCESTGKKAVIYEPGKRPSLGTELASTVILNLPASRTMRNKYLLFISPPACYILL